MITREVQKLTRTKIDATFRKYTKQHIQLLALPNKLPYREAPSTRNIQFPKPYTLPQSLLQSNCSNLLDKY